MKKIAKLVFLFWMFTHNVFAFPLGEGSKGEEVYSLQVLLIASGFLSDDADGEFGPNTKAGVIKAQQKFDFETTGVAGNALYSMLLEYATKIGEANNLPVGGVVKIGTKGPGVTAVQEKLQKLHHYDGIIDGVAGVRTAVAIAKFQKNVGMWASGIADGDTQEELDRIKNSSGKTMKMRATAYSPEDPGISPYTAIGKKVKRGIVATDPKIIPLGTRLFIEGYGVAIAADVGGTIKGYTIDIAFDTHREAINFGRRDVLVTILD